VSEGQNIGHGHVFKRPDGNKMRCGGPEMCSQCAEDLGRKIREEARNAFDFQFQIDAAEKRAKDLEKTLKNIIAVGYGSGTPASRMIKMLDIAEKTEQALRDGQVGGIPA